MLPGTCELPRGQLPERQERALYAPAARSSLMFLPRRLRWNPDSGTWCWTSGHPATTHALTAPRQPARRQTR